MCSCTPNGIKHVRSPSKPIKTIKCFLSFNLYETRPNTIKQIMCPNGNVWSWNSSWSPNNTCLNRALYGSGILSIVLRMLFYFAWVISYCYSSTSIVIAVVYVLKKSNIKTLVIVSNRNHILFFSARKRWAWSRDCDQVLVFGVGSVRYPKAAPSQTTNLWTSWS